MKIDVEDVEKIVKSEVLKREIVEGDEADAARIRVGKFYRKGAAPRTVKKLDEPAASPPPPSTQESVTERLLREAEDQQPVEQSHISRHTGRDGARPSREWLRRMAGG